MNMMTRAMRRNPNTSLGNGIVASELRNGAGMFRAPRPLTEEEMMKYAPSIFAEDKHVARSAKYTYVPTIFILRGLKEEGWQPVAVRQGGTRDETRRGFTRHIIRMRKQSDTMKSVGDTVPELVLKNAHDGSAAYELMSGWFRLACLNGMVVADKRHPEFAIKFPHKGDIVPDIVDASYKVIDEMKVQREQIKQMTVTTLKLSEQRKFAEKAMELRFGERPAGSILTPDSVLVARRNEDTGNDLWTTFQRIQENLTKGGQQYHTIGANGRTTHRTTRPVAGIDSDVAINKQLWLLASEWLARKEAA